MSEKREQIKAISKALFYVGYDPDPFLVEGLYQQGLRSEKVTPSPVVNISSLPKEIVLPMQYTIENIEKHRR